MNENDKRCIKEIFQEELKPLKTEVERQGKLSDKMHQTIYGSDGEGGVKHVLNVVKDDVDGLKNFRTQVKTVAVTVLPMVQAGVTVFIMWVKSIITGR